MTARRSPSPIRRLAPLGDGSLARNAPRRDLSSDPVVEADRINRFARRPAAELSLPAVNYVTPSAPNDWRGARDEDAKFTRNQLAAMRVAGIDPDQVETVTVRSAITMREMWWPSTDEAPVYVIPCPILRRSRDGKFLRVLAASGRERWVYPDGRITAGRG